MAKFDNLKSSQVLKIKAAALEIMEEAGFEVSDDVKISKCKEENNRMMTFYKDRASLDDLVSMQTNFGEKFNITVEAKDKSLFAVLVEAHEDSFISLLGEDVAAKVEEDYHEEDITAGDDDVIS